MLEPLQDLVDDLAEHLQRSVAIDDAQLKLVVSSRHFGDEDEVRVGALVGRRPSEAAVAHVLAQGVRSLQRPARVRGDPALGLRDRFCVPLRSESELFGFAWLIDDGTLADADVAAVVAAAERMTATLAHKRRDEAEAVAQQEELVRALLSGDAATVAISARGVLDRGLLPDQHHYTVFVSTPRASHDLPPGALEELLAQGRRILQPAYTGESSAARLSARLRNAVATISASRTLPSAEQVERTCERLNKTLIRREGGVRLAGWATAGGTATSDLAEVRRSYDQALRTLQVATSDEGPTATWQSLSPLDTVLAVVPRDSPEHLTPQLLRTVRTELSDELRDTVRWFLDAAGDAARVAQELHLHRSTVYYRLTRAEQVLGLSFADGTARTAVHLCLILDAARRRDRPCPPVPGSTGP